MSKLVCVSGMNKEDEFPLTEGATIVGRAPECAVVLFDKKCSRKHCQIFKKGNYFAVEDLESRHGTLLNGKPVTKRQSAAYGDKIQIGRTILLLSDRAFGNLVEQTASDVAADLQGKGFDKLIDSAAADVIMHNKGEAKETGLKGLIKAMFSKK